MQQTRRLIEVMARLRDPQRGCAWDLRQDFASIAPYTIEEAYEVADAIARQDMAELRDELRDELGDLLLQVAFHARMAEEVGLFDFEAVAQAIGDKLVRRHPHVFEGVEFGSDAERAAAWEEIKRQERRDKGVQEDSQESLLDGIAQGLPALMRAEKLQKAAARGGFDWTDPEPVVAKVREELAEVEAQIGSDDRDALAEEVGDLLFAAANLARHLGIDPEHALRQGNRKFEQRFRRVEAAVRARGEAITDMGLAELDRIWDQIKRHE